MDLQLCDTCKNRFYQGNLHLDSTSSTITATNAAINLSTTDQAIAAASEVGEKNELNNGNMLVETSISRNKEFCCPTCFGIAQNDRICKALAYAIEHDLRKKFLLPPPIESKIDSTIANKNTSSDGNAAKTLSVDHDYQFSVSFSLVLPPGLADADKNAASMFPSSEQIISVKDAVRLQVIDFMKSKYSIVHNREAPLTLTIECTAGPEGEREEQHFSDDDEEKEHLQTMAFQKRKRRRNQRKPRPIHYDLKNPPPFPSAIKVSFKQANFYLAGRYKKMVRGIPQTNWTTEDGEQKGDLSVEEYISRVLAPMFKCPVGSQYKLIGSGREDIDVRMLGDGRPFVMEFPDPHNTIIKEVLTDAYLKDLEQQIKTTSNGKIEVHGLHVSDKSQILAISESADTKKKQYSCVIFVPDEISEDILRVKIDDYVKNQPHGLLVVNQDTPVRVFHRRAQLTREKTVSECKTIFLSPHFFVLNLTTSAGTYVKEFVHGDFGRTRPNVAELLGVKEADIFQLDVVDVIL